MPAIDTLRTIAAASIRPAPDLSVSDWADQNRVLDSRSSAEPGPWRTARTPYLRDIMDAMGPAHSCETVVVKSSSQVGKSETLNNALGFYIDHAPAPIMLVQPTKEAAERYSRQRITPLVERSPALRGKVSERKSRDTGNKLDAKEFLGGVLFLVGANSPVGLASSPIRVLLADEIDRWTKSIPGEGDPLEIVERRTATFHNRKKLKTSTPTVKGQSRIELEYARSDQRKYFVPCPDCGTFQVFKWACVKWPAGDPAGAAYQCEHCEVLIPHYKKPEMLERGYWQAEDEDEAERVRNVFDPPVKRDPRSVGFWLSSLYSPWVSWGEVAQQFVQCGKDRELLRVFVNTLLGEEWDLDDGEDISEDDLLERREVFGPGCPEGPEVPAGVAVLTCGVDIQADRFELEVVGWGLGEESWSIDYVVSFGDPSSDPKRGQFWKDLDAALRRVYMHEDGHEMKIEAACIDTGHQALNVYSFVKPRQKRRVWGIKGKHTGERLWPRAPTRRNKGRIDLYMLAVGVAKESIYARLRQTEAGPGYCHFPADRVEDYFQQLTAERMKTRYKRGFAVKFWELPSGRKNEALDCRVYAFAALHGWRSNRHTIQGALDRIGRGTDLKTGKSPARKRSKRWLKSRKHWI